VDLFKILLFLHVIAAVAAFGPGFASMIVGPMVAKEPQHANWYARTQVTTGRRLITPLSISMAVTGIAMILVRGWSAIVGGRHWLEIGILLYVVAVVVAMAVQAPAGRKLVELTSTPPAPGAGPSPELPKVAARLRTGGMALSGLVVVIVFLMVAKPF
jgi:uncharacterized membrane protein